MRLRAQQRRTYSVSTTVQSARWPVHRRLGGSKSTSVSGSCLACTDEGTRSPSQPTGQRAHAAEVGAEPADAAGERVAAPSTSRWRCGPGAVVSGKPTWLQPTIQSNPVRNQRGRPSAHSGDTRSVDADHVRVRRSGTRKFLYPVGRRSGVVVGGTRLYLARGPPRAWRSCCPRLFGPSLRTSTTPGNRVATRSGGARRCGRPPARLSMRRDLLGAAGTSTARSSDGERSSVYVHTTAETVGLERCGGTPGGT